MCNKTSGVNQKTKPQSWETGVLLNYINLYYKRIKEKKMVGEKGSVGGGLEGNKHLNALDLIIKFDVGQSHHPKFISSDQTLIA